MAGNSEFCTHTRVREPENLELQAQDVPVLSTECSGCRELRDRLDRLEAAIMADPAIRDRIKFQQMAEHVVDVAKAEGQLLPPIEPGEPPL